LGDRKTWRMRMKRGRERRRYIVHAPTSSSYLTSTVLVGGKTDCLIWLLLTSHSRWYIMRSRATLGFFNHRKSRYGCSHLNRSKLREEVYARCVNDCQFHTTQRGVPFLASPWHYLFIFLKMGNEVFGTSYGHRWYRVHPPT
jgi:hypothetical protein